MKKTTSSKEKIELLVEKRHIFGKKLKKARKEGKFPANLFGEGVKSQALFLPVKEFLRVYRTVGETQIVYLKIKDEKEEVPVLIQNVQRHPVTDHVLHADFRQVNLKKKIETAVPLKFVGESPAVNQNKGVLLILTDSLRIEALPGSIPQLIEVDLSSLKELNDEIKVKDLQVGENYLIKERGEKTIARITVHKEEKMESQVVAPEVVQVTGEKKEEEEKAKAEEKPSTTSAKPAKPETSPN